MNVDGLGCSSCEFWCHGGTFCDLSPPASQELKSTILINLYAINSFAGY